jgi:REP element-mobilizing transposase RayT
MENIDSLFDGEYPFFNPFDEFIIRNGVFPHWTQEDVFYFITFRLADSIPKKKLEILKTDREEWYSKGKDKKEYTSEDWIQYNRLFNKRVEDWMNAGYGSCLLRSEKNALIVKNALLHFENERYILDECVIMPNHVHILVRPINGHQLPNIMHSWKSYTANEINKNERLQGQLWMHESYDHIVRHPKAFAAIKNYVKRNPDKAGIKLSDCHVIHR